MMFMKNHPWSNPRETHSGKRGRQHPELIFFVRRATHLGKKDSKQRANKFVLTTV